MMNAHQTYVSPSMMRMKFGRIMNIAAYSYALLTAVHGAGAVRLELAGFKPNSSPIWGLRKPITAYRCNAHDLSLRLRGGSSVRQYVGDSPDCFANNSTNAENRPFETTSTSTSTSTSMLTEGTMEQSQYHKIDLKTKTSTTHKLTEGDASITSNDDSDEYKAALFKTALTISAAGLFGVALMATKGVSTGLEFYAGYLIEQSLSIDNLFVFIMLFEYFNIPPELQNRVLSWGIGGAIALRGLMIGVGVAVLQRFRSVILVFAGILIASSLNLLFEKEHEDGTNSATTDENFIMKLSKFIFPNTSSELHGESFFTTNSVGEKIATPLFLCLVCVELSDFVFAVDSIPAVLGVSSDPFVVYASNIFAICSMRALYTVVAKAVSNFHYLKPAVALVLGFVGSKMVAEFFHYEIGTGVSLGIISSLLGGGMAASILETKRRDRNHLILHL